MEWMSLTEKLELICSLTRNRTGAQAQGRRVKDRVWCAKIWTTSLFSPLVASEGMMIYTAFPGPTGHTASWSAVDTQSKQVSLHALPGNLDLESSKTKLSCEVLTERSGRWKMKPGARGWVGWKSGCGKGEWSNCMKRSDERPQSPKETDDRAASLLVSFILPTTGFNEDALYTFLKIPFEPGNGFNNNSLYTYFIPGIVLHMYHREWVLPSWKGPD